MLASERQIIILKKLEKSGVVYLKQLSEELHASICTIRRDFEKLEKMCIRDSKHSALLRAV